MRVAIGDFETRCDVDLKKCGVERYVESPNFAVSCLAHCFDDGNGIDQPIDVWDALQFPEDIPLPTRALFAHVAGGGTFIAHNARFEITCWNEMHRRQPHIWPRMDAAQVIDTMAQARAVSMPAALGDLAPALRLPFGKDKEGHKLMLKLCKPRKPKKGERLGGLLWNEDPADLERQMAYCARDVEVERAVWRKLPKLSASERELWVLDQEINDTGVPVDVAAAAACAALVATEKERLDHELFMVTSGYVKTANSAKALRNWLAAYDCQLPDLRKNTVDDALQSWTLPPDVRRALEIRQEAAKSSTGKLAAVVRGACADGRMRGLMGFHGASTGRWIGARFNPLNLPRTPETFGENDSSEVFGWLTI